MIVLYTLVLPEGICLLFIMHVNYVKPCASRDKTIELILVFKVKLELNGMMEEREWNDDG